MQNQHLLGFVLVCCAGLMWSFGAPIIRSLEHVELYRYQYLISRMFVAAPIILLFILFRDKGIFFPILSVLIALACWEHCVLRFHQLSGYTLSL
jgi:drug/metabolite transporter (DMT)-like permease